jgi:hypothetical protein
MTENSALLTGGVWTLGSRRLATLLSPYAVDESQDTTRRQASVLGCPLAVSSGLR